MHLSVNVGALLLIVHTHKYIATALYKTNFCVLKSSLHVLNKALYYDTHTEAIIR